MSGYPPYDYSNQWQYGYTLGPPSDANRGDYTVYQQYAAAAAAAAATPTAQPPLPPQQQQQQQFRKQNTGSVNNIQIPTGAPAKPQSWSDIKKNKPPMTFKAQVFVTAAPSSGSTDTVTSTSMSEGADLGENAVKQINELAAFNQIFTKYDTVEDAANKMFSSTLTLGTERYVGMGNTAEAAERNAAMQAMVNSSYTAKKTMKIRPSGTTGVTPTSELYELSQKKGVHVEFKFLEPFNFTYYNSMKMWKKEEMRGNYKVQLKVSGQEFIGQAEYPQLAKHEASSQAISFLESLPDRSGAPLGDPATPNPSSSNDPSQSMASSSDSGGEHKNPIMYLNEIGMCHGLPIEWEIQGSSRPQHLPSFTWKVKMSTYEACGTGSNKKTAKNMAASSLIELLPAELKSVKKKRKGLKRGKKMNEPQGFQPKTLKTALLIDGKVISDAGAPVQGAALSSNPIGPQLPDGGMPKSAKASQSLSGVPIHTVIQNPNPICALYEYCRKARINEPEFDCISENVLETWQQGSHTFKKTEYTMRLEIDEKAYFASANMKKVAKTKVAEEAWNIIRAGKFP